MTNRPPIVEAHGIGRATTNVPHQWLVRDVRLTVSAGERIALVGPSGSGKTVLLRLLAMLDPIDAGQLFWRGAPVTRDAIPRYRSHVIYLHQRPALIEGTVIENFRYPFRFVVHRQRRFDRSRIERWLEVLGRDGDFLEKQSRDLSGGEQQITALLRAVQLGPDVLLLDEPTAALDQTATEAVERCVQQWQAERPEERSFVVVSHNLRQVRRMVDQTLVMQAGKLLVEN